MGTAGTGFSFEWSIRFSDVLTIVSAFIVAAAFLYRRGGQEGIIQATLESLARELNEMKIEFKTFSATLTKVAIQEEKIALLMKWYDELRRGKGFITRPGPNERGVDGEY